jgi:hypothetical protein
MAVGSSGGLAVVVMLVEEKVCRFNWPSFVDIIIRFLSFFFLFFVCILVQMPIDALHKIFNKRTIVHK